MVTCRGLYLLAILQLESIYSTMCGLGESITITVTVEAWCHWLKVTI